MTKINFDLSTPDINLKIRTIEELKQKFTNPKLVDSITFNDSNSFYYLSSNHRDFLHSFHNITSISFEKTIITQ